jgi:glycosyltransferase involved in cell wall biosynthesis
MRLTLVISSLERGGAERIMVQLANSWAQLGYQVTVLAFDDAHPGYEVHSAVDLQRLRLSAESKNFLQALTRNFRRLRLLRRAIRESKPDIVISFMDKVNVITLAATRGLGRPVVVYELADPGTYDIGRTWSGLRRITYRFADALVCLTSPALTFLQARTKVRGYVIQGAVTVLAHPTSHTARDEGSHTLIAMGRLSTEKGFDLLLDAFARIAAHHPDWSLKILGQGPLRSALQAQAWRLDLGERVRFAGEVPDPFPILSAADLFVFPSRSEGFGMALAEAMACGLPVVSFDCPSGPRDIVRDGVDGILVPPEDVAAMAAALDRLMGDAQERQRLAARAPEVTTRFSRERVLSLWQNVFNDLSTSRRARASRL